MRQAGRLTERIRIERRAATSDGAGNFEGAWATLVSGLPAEIRPVRGGEQVLADALVSVVEHEVRIGGSSATRAIRAGDRVVTERASAALPAGMAFNIRAVTNPDQRGVVLVLRCDAGVADTEPDADEESLAGQPIGLLLALTYAE